MIMYVCSYVYMYNYACYYIATQAMYVNISNSSA